MSGFFFMLGWIFIVGGFIIEMVAMAAMGSYPIRRALPVQSPVALQAMGCTVFMGGWILLLVAELLG